MTAPITIGSEEILTLRVLRGVPTVMPGDNLGELTLAALARTGVELRDRDVLVMSSKIVSRAEDRFVDLSTVLPSGRAERLGARTGKDPRVVELVLRESSAISRAARGALVVRHRLGFVCADAGIDFSNAGEPGARTGPGPWALLLPADPDRSAAGLRAALERASGKHVGVIVSDSHGRPFRLGTLGAAIGISGLPALWDRRGELDRHGRKLEHTQSALGDQVATAADLVAGQAAEGRPLIHVRGLHFAPADDSARRLCRPLEQDLYAGAERSDEAR